VKHLMTLAAVAAALVAAALAPVGAGAQVDPQGVSPALTLTTVATLDDPIAMTLRPGRPDDLYVAEREGVVRRLVLDGDDVTVSPTPVVDVTDFTTTTGERGLLGLAFSPDGKRLFLYHTNPQGNIRVVEYRMSGAQGNGNVAVASTRRIVLRVGHPGQSNHNGGAIAYGPDNRLYVALGDGGGSGDPNNNGQRRTVLLGKILRINPNQAPNASFTSPATNPYFNDPPRLKAIWLYGVRNPWRISFDTATGDLYVADVGQGEWEEIDALAADEQGRNAGRGANLGWRRMEGTHPFNGGHAPADHTPPIYEYDHSNDACAVVGGYVYHGDAIPSLDGWYLYGDFCNGIIGMLQAVDGELVSNDPNVDIAMPDFTLQSFGQDASGEVYVLGGNGTVARIDPDVP
jgi:glucose/arabinose dehydrogenase